jgi:hypothetical protein
MGVKITKNCTTLPQSGIYRRQTTVTKLNISISFLHSILQKKINSSNDHGNVVIISLNGAVINRLVSCVERRKVRHGMCLCRG